MTPEAVDKLFNTVGPRFGDRNGGYTRIILTGFRKGDGGAKAFIEILGSEKVVDEKGYKRAELRAKRAEETRKAMEQQGPAAEGGEEPPAEELHISSRSLSGGEEPGRRTQASMRAFGRALKATKDSNGCPHYWKGVLPFRLHGCRRTKSVSE